MNLSFPDNASCSSSNLRGFIEHPTPLTWEMANDRFWDDSGPTNLDMHPALRVLGFLSGLFPVPLLETIGKRWQSLKICCWHIDIKHRELWSSVWWQHNSKNSQRGDYYRVLTNESALTSVWTHLSPIGQTEIEGLVLYESTGDSLAESSLSQALLSSLWFSARCGFSVTAH